MPSFTARPIHVGRTMRLTRWLCDGHDADGDRGGRARDGATVAVAERELFGNAFRARVGTTPARARKTGTLQLQRPRNRHTDAP